VHGTRAAAGDVDVHRVDAYHHRPATHIVRPEVRDQMLRLDRESVAPAHRSTHHQCRLIHETLERHGGRIASIGVALKRAVDVRTRVGDQLHADDLKLCARFVQRA